MSDTMEEHHGKVSISSRNIITLQFAKEIDAVAEEEQEQETLVESLNKTCAQGIRWRSDANKQIKWQKLGYCNKLY